MRILQEKIKNSQLPARRVLMESFYNNRVYKEGYHLKNNNCHHNNAKKENRLTTFH